MKNYDFEITEILVSKFFQTTQMSFLIIYIIYCNICIIQYQSKG